jgi:hypothetical protein
VSAKRTEDLDPAAPYTRLYRERPGGPLLPNPKQLCQFCGVQTAAVFPSNRHYLKGELKHLYVNAKDYCFPSNLCRKRVCVAMYCWLELKYEDSRELRIARKYGVLLNRPRDYERYAGFSLEIVLVRYLDFVARLSKKLADQVQH